MKVFREPWKGGSLPGENDFETIGDIELNENDILNYKLQDCCLFVVEVP